MSLEFFKRRERSVNLPSKTLIISPNLLYQVVSVTLLSLEALFKITNWLIFNYLTTMAEGEGCEPQLVPPLFSYSWQSANVFL